MVTGHNAPHNSVLEYLKGRTQKPNNPLSQQFTQPQNLTTHIPPEKTLPMAERTPQRQSSDSSNPINKFAEAIAAIVSQQRPQTLSALFKPLATNTLIFDGK